eukprot:8574548-Lingulodinium_polyedra.AAC.1
MPCVIGSRLASGAAACGSDSEEHACRGSAASKPAETPCRTRQPERPPAAPAATRAAACSAAIGGGTARPE